MTTVSNILENLKTSEGIEVTKLEKSLKISKKLDKEKLDIALSALKKLDIIKTLDNNKIVINTDNDLIRGRIRCSSKGYCFVVREDQGEDIYIRESHLNHAWHGDSVLVRITKEGLKRRAPEGCVQCILKRYNDILLAKIYFDKTTDTFKAYPLDDRIPAIIDIQIDKDEFELENKLDIIYEIKINRYPLAQLTATGSVLRALSLHSGVEGDIEILLSKNNIPREITSPKASPKKIPSKGREDLTSQPTLLFRSWEKPNSPALPALYAEPYDGGTRLWIHSPTVSERINIGSKLDEYLKDRGEVICLGNNWLDFLNEPLKKASEFKVNNICEAITLIIDINNNGIVTDWYFTPSIIKPVNLITSKQLDCIDKRKSTSKSIPIAIRSIKDNLELVYTILHSANLINQRDNATIHLDLDIPNLERLSELQKNYPSRDFHGWSTTYDSTDPQSIIDVFIRLSNNILARHLSGYKLPFIYKKHEEIEQSSINELTKSAFALDKKIVLNVDGNPSTSDLLKSFNSSEEKKILHKLVKHIIPGIHLKLFIHTDSMHEDDSQFLYELDNIESPWCCPTLNYWNIINQFVLTSLLINGKDKPSSRSKNEIDLGKKDSWNEISWELFSPKVKETIDSIATLKLVHQLNEVRKQTKTFRNNIISIAQGREAANIIGMEVNAVITGVQSYGFFAEIQDLKAEGLVHVSTLGDDWYEYRSRQNLLVGRKNKKTYQLGQKINVRVLKVDILKNQIDLELVSKDIIKQAEHVDLITEEDLSKKD